MLTIDLPPGVVNVAAKKARTGRWRETHLVRWEEGNLLPVGGWEAVNYTEFESRLRCTHKWIDNSGIQNIAYLCEEHCYVDPGDGVLIDITPVDGITPPPSIGIGGYGLGPYGEGTYGTPRDSVDFSLIATPCYALDNWGGELRAMTSSDGRLLRWNPATPATPLVAVTNAPAGRTFVVTPERHIIVFAAGGEVATFAWCDEEDDTDWTPAIDSKAGSLSVEPRAPIMAAKVVANGVLFHTARAAYLIRWVGIPYIYQYSIITDCACPMTAMALIPIPTGAMWFALNGFWEFNGASVAPMPCEIWDWINVNINRTTSKYEAVAINVPTKFEVWFSFVAGDGSTNNRMAIYNYRDRIWSMGYVGRTCGVSYANDPYPYMSDGTLVYKHESGFQYPGADLPWAETHTIDVNLGWNKTTIKQMLPEVRLGSDAVNFQFYKSNNPVNGVETVSAAKSIRSNGMVDVRETARAMRMRVNMVANRNWSIGPIQVDAVARGANS